MPNQDDRRVEQYVVISGIKSCSAVEKTRQDTFCEFVALIK